MGTIRKIDWKNLKHEYGVDGERLLPFGKTEFPFPFGGSYCIVRSKNTSTEHINEPADEDEMFIAIKGKGMVNINDESTEIVQGDVIFIPAGESHFVDNPFDEDFHFYALWWNESIMEGYKKEKEIAPSIII